MSTQTIAQLLNIEKPECLFFLRQDVVWSDSGQPEHLNFWPCQTRIQKITPSCVSFSSSSSCFVLVNLLALNACGSAKKLMLGISASQRRDT